MEWRYTDPRLDINKRANIIICRPSINGQLEIGTAHVDTKEGWWIFTNFKKNKNDSNNIEWNQDWCWDFAPHKGLYDWCHWKNSDPRLNDNSNDIIIVNGCNHTSFGIINNKNLWSVKTSFEGHEIVEVDDQWDQDWWWIYAPESKYERQYD